MMGVDSNLYPSDVSSHEKAHAFSKGKSKVDYDDTWAHQIMVCHWNLLLFICCIKVASFSSE